MHSTHRLCCLCARVCGVTVRAQTPVCRAAAARACATPTLVLASARSRVSDCDASCDAVRTTAAAAARATTRRACARAMRAASARTARCARASPTALRSARATTTRAGVAASGQWATRPRSARSTTVPPRTRWRAPATARASTTRGSASATSDGGASIAPRKCQTEQRADRVVLVAKSRSSPTRFTFLFRISTSRPRIRARWLCARVAEPAPHRQIIKACLQLKLMRMHAPASEVRRDGLKENESMISLNGNSVVEQTIDSAAKQLARGAMLTVSGTSRVV